MDSSSDEKPYIPYKYENAKNRVYKEKNIDTSEMSKTNSDIMANIDKEAKKINNKIKQSDLKVFSKYQNYSEEELLNLIKEKNESLIKLSDEKDKTKKALNNIIKKLNNTISNNADILCKADADPETIFDLENTLESKKKLLKASKNLNQTTKSQYNSLINKKVDNNNGKDGKKNDIEIHLNDLKNENKNLELQIRKYKDDGVSKQKELEIICEDKIYPAKIKMKSDQFQDILNQKHGYSKKINLSLNSLKNLIKELNYLEKIYSEVDKDKMADENEKMTKNIDFWINIIKNDLMGTEKEIISRIEKNESNFINEIDKKANSKNDIINKIKSSSPGPNEKLYINRSLKKMKIRNNLETEEINNTYNYRQVINKGINSNLYYSQNNVKKILTASNKYRSKNISTPKGVFAKFSFLKHKPNTTENKVKNMNNSGDEKNIEEILGNIIDKDYNDTTDADYRELLDKKSEYLEKNLILDENIKKVQRTVNNKYNSVEVVVQENTNRLNLLKSRNELLEKEVNNLNNVYQLTLEKYKIKNELKRKEYSKDQENKKQTSIVNPLDSSAIEKNILNALKESTDSNLPKKKRKKKISKDNDSNSKNENDNETRDEKLQKIKKKYMEMNDECIDESDIIE